jgi:hypothetical protein
MSEHIKLPDERPHPAPHAPTASHPPTEAQVEDPDIRFRTVAIGAGIFVGVIALTCWGVWILFAGHLRSAREADHADRTLATTIHEQRENASLEDIPLDKRLPPEPTLEGLATPPAVGNPLPLVRGLSPIQDVGKPMMGGALGWPSAGPAQAVAQDQVLAKLAWVNEKEGVVRLPIEEVMKQLAEKKRLKTRSSDPGGDVYQTPSRAGSGRPPVGDKK